MSTTAVEHKKPTRRVSISGFFNRKAERKVSVVTRQHVDPVDVIIEEAGVFSCDVETAKPKVDHTHIVRDKKVEAINKITIPKEDIARNALNREIRSKQSHKLHRKKGTTEAPYRTGIFDSFRNNRKPAKYSVKTKESAKTVTKANNKNKSLKSGLDSPTGSIFGYPDGSPASPLYEYARARNLQLFDDESPTCDRRSNKSLSPEESPRSGSFGRFSINSQPTTDDESDSAPTRKVQDLSTIKVVNDGRAIKNGILKIDRSPVSEDDGIGSGSTTPISVLVTPCSNSSDSDSYARNGRTTSESTVPTSPDEDVDSTGLYTSSTVSVDMSTFPRSPKKKANGVDKTKSRSQESLLSTIVNAVTGRISKEGESDTDLEGALFSTAHVRSVPMFKIGSTSSINKDVSIVDVTTTDKSDDDVFNSEFTTWEGRGVLTLPRPKHRKIGKIGMCLFNNNPTCCLPASVVKFIPFPA